MSKVTITLEDMEDGKVAQTVSYGAKFEVKSNAHQYAGIMIKLAGDFARGTADEEERARNKLLDAGKSGLILLG